MLYSLWWARSRYICNGVAVQVAIHLNGDVRTSEEPVLGLMLYVLENARYDGENGKTESAQFRTDRDLLLYRCDNQLRHRPTKSCSEFIIIYLSIPPVYNSRMTPVFPNAVFDAPYAPYAPFFGHRVHRIDARRLALDRHTAQLLNLSQLMLRR